MTRPTPGGPPRTPSSATSGAPAGSASHETSPKSAASTHEPTAGTQAGTHETAAGTHETAAGADETGAGGQSSTAGGQNGAQGPVIGAVAFSVRLGERRVLDRVDLSVRPGEWLAVLGPNGAGKSTLLKAVMGLLAHDGEITLGGRPARELRPRDRARLVAYAPQTPALPPDMTVFDYALLGRTPYIPYLGRESHHDREVTASVLDRLDLSGLATRRAGELSGGERQRAVLARALAQQAPVLLLDEPTTALDLGHQQQVLELVDRLRLADGLTVVTTLHDLTLAGQYADTLLLLADGRVAAAGRPAEVLTEDLVGRHFGAGVQVQPGPDGRPVVHLVRGGPRR
ncbi:ABC transporter ATP-binding protein [Nonomuraea roseoviolacea]|uniref:Iron complex transport system ATP-binding protein n=1 Tax=Nonomuraea roseoviolacea subsp. carminata TaxID=160689 RepID=A0ABT1JT64_9ACTN|nr:ABC transporter ATP-binding protein [Nonomuraea roseoviolacea]MCP2344622.1 iron complex transport system ATP-binding protein [Nonomuraea roseoviolacea subsp. carminata]